MKHRLTKRLAAVAAATVLALCATVLPTSSAHADSGWDYIVSPMQTHRHGK